jgi:general secretion pathway protein G
MIQNFQLARRIRRGFTLLEIMTVMAIILILIGMAAGKYHQSVVRTKEATLKQDLWVLRQAIEQYTIDKQRGPQSLEELVSAGYLREVPVDPITGRKDWNVSFDDLMISPEQVSSGISDVRSASDKVSPFEGTPYSSW